jgi:hypothetical protein
MLIPHSLNGNSLAHFNDFGIINYLKMHFTVIHGGGVAKRKRKEKFCFELTRIIFELSISTQGERVSE